MDWIKDLLKWAEANETLLWSLFAVSVGVFLLTPIAVAWATIKLPENYFIEKRRKPLGSWEKYPALRLVVLIGKNLLGIVLLIAGLVMLVVPGQGLLTIVVGLILLDFPGKFRLQRWIVKRPSVWRSINWVRKRAGRPPLKRPS